MKIRNILRRAAVLALCLMLTVSGALAQGIRFNLRASIDPAQYPAGHAQLFSGLAQLLEAASVEGTLITSGSSFDLQSTFYLGHGSSQSATQLRVYGLDSHWGVSSPLLGNTELMVNCAALLPFGQKARNYLDLPLDTLALLAPYTHVDALKSVRELTIPLFPERDGKVTLTRSEMDEMVTELMRLCDEDPALNRWLETTGLYNTAMRYCRGYFSLPEFLLPSLTVKRSGSTLTWTSGVLTLLSIKESGGVTTLAFSLPTLAEASATIREEGAQLSGEMEISLDSLQAEVSFAFPMKLSGSRSEISLQVDAVSPALPDNGLKFSISGETKGNELSLRVYGQDSSSVLLTVEGTLIPFGAAELPAYTPADLTGVNILSVNSDSLRHLLSQIRWPLLDGLFDILVAAPAPAVQTLMDYAEDSGLIDLLTDAMSGGSGY